MCTSNKGLGKDAKLKKQTCAGDRERERDGLTEIPFVQRNV